MKKKKKKRVVYKEFGRRDVLPARKCMIIKVVEEIKERDIRNGRSITKGGG